MAQRWQIYVWLTGLLLSVLLIQHIPPKVLTESTGARDTEAYRVMQYLRRDFGFQEGNTLALVLQGPSVSESLVLHWVTSRFKQVKSLQRLPESESDLDVYMLDVGPDFQFVEGQIFVPQLRQHLQPLTQAQGLKSYVTGNLAFYADIVHESEQALSGTEHFAFVAAFVILLFSFGSVLMACLPLLMGVSTLLVFQGVMRIFSLETTPMSATLNTVLGLALAIDYALFWVSRFREERARMPLQEAITQTRHATGRTIGVSALIVMCSIGVLLIPDISGLRIMALNLLTVVALSAAHALWVLPALVQRAHRALDWPHALSRCLQGFSSQTLWEAYARHITAYPKRYFALSLLLFGLLCLPLSQTRLWDPVQTLASEQAESIQGYQLLAERGWGGKMVPIYVLVEAPAGQQIDSPAGLAYITQLTQTLQAQPEVSGVLSLSSWHPDIRMPDWMQQLLPEARPEIRWINQAGNLHLIQVFPRDIMQVANSHLIADKIRAYANTHPEYAVYTGGVLERARDFTREMYRHTAWMVGLVLGSIFVVLLFSMKAVLLPIKAGIMNFFPLLGAFGILSLLYHGQISSMIPLTLFCLIFGLSMDYEVLILSRISEYYVHSGEVRESIVQGMARSGSVISSAALILLAVFLPTLFSPSPAVKELGWGIMAALFIDATLLRLLLVPSFMMLLGHWNWALYRSNKEG